MQLTDRHRRIWIALFAGLCLLPWICIPMDIAWGKAVAMGRTINSGLIFSLAWLVMVLPFARRLAGRERIFLLLPLLLVAWAVLGVFDTRISGPLTYGGLLAILGGSAAGVSAFALQRDGHDLRGVLIAGLVLAALPVCALPLLHARIEAPDPVYLYIFGFSNIRATGAFLVLGIVALAPFAATRTARLPLALLAPVLLWSVLAWSGSRAALVSLCAALLVVLPSGAGRAARLCANLAAMVAGGALSLLYSAPSSHFDMFGRVGETARRMSDGGANAVASGRLDIWAWAVGAIADKPFAGWGFGSMFWIPGAPPFYHTHNIVLEYALAFGIPVALAVSVFVAWLVLAGLVRTLRPRSGADLAVGGILLLLPAYAMLSAVLLNPFPLVVLLSAVGIALGRRPHDRRDGARIPARIHASSRQGDRISPGPAGVMRAHQEATETGMNTRKTATPLYCDRRGASLAEYAILLGLISVMVVGGVLATGVEIRDVYDSLTGRLADPDGSSNATIAAMLPVADPLSPPGTVLGNVAVEGGSATGYRLSDPEGEVAIDDDGVVTVATPFAEAGVTRELQVTAILDDSTEITRPVTLVIGPFSDLPADPTTKGVVLVDGPAFTSDTEDDDDEDWVKVTLGEAGDLAIEVRGVKIDHRPAMRYPQVTLHDGSGQRVGDRADAQYGDLTGMVENDLPAGTYYIGVNVGGTVYSEAGGYAIEVDLVEEPAPGATSPYRISVGDRVNGTFLHGDEADTWRITIPDGADNHYQFVLDGRGGAPDLDEIAIRLRKQPSNETVASTSSVVGYDMAAIVVNDLAPGEYSISAINTRDRAAGDYRLVTRHVPDDQAASVATSGRADPGARTPGSAIEGDKGDWFEVELTEAFLGGGESDIQIWADPDTSSPIDLGVSLYSATGSLLESSSDNTNVIQSVAAGTYHVLVRRLKTYGRGELGYQLHVNTVVDAPGQGEMEDALLYDTDYIIGQVIDGEKQDHYRYDIPAGTYYFAIDGDKTADPHFTMTSPALDVLDSGSKVLGSTWPDQAADAVHTVVIPEDGTYYLRAFGGGNSMGSYRTYFSATMEGNSQGFER